MAETPKKDKSIKVLEQDITDAERRWKEKGWVIARVTRSDKAGKQPTVILHLQKL